MLQFIVVPDYKYRDRKGRPFLGGGKKVFKIREWYQPEPIVVRSRKRGEEDTIIEMRDGCYRDVLDEKGRFSVWFDTKEEALEEAARLNEHTELELAIA